ncbi:glycosyltransferase [Actinomycetota bacterium]|nr:glycosyltransferase [Actinomycetota bacterium]
MSEVPWLTIVTVVKDDLPGLEKTIRSLVEQVDLSGVEYLVIDSSENSPAVEAAVKVSMLTGARFSWCEPQGIYTAMNTGLDLARGKYIYYLNAGDLLADPQVIADLKQTIEAVDPVWVVGRVEISEVSGKTVVSKSWDYHAEKRARFARGVFPPHQGTIVRTESLRTVGGFDGQFVIAADYAAALSLSLVSDPFMTDRVIATFFEGGVSTERWQDSFREFDQARQLILKPQGFASLVERFHYGKHFASVWLVRNLRRS